MSPLKVARSNKLTSIKGNKHEIKVKSKLGDINRAKLQKAIKNNKGP